MEHKIYNLNEFELLKIIHEKTNYSIIYLARHKITQEEVILKYFISSDIKTKIFEHIAKEIFINKYLSDTDITINYRGICIDNDKRYIFLVLEKGDFSLYYYLQKVSYTMDDFKKIFYELVKIIFILHKYSIVHNDIKLENFLFVDKQIKIIDFGLSDFLTYSPQHEIITHYICSDYTKAPDTTKSYETDIYSLGLTAIHLILQSYFKINLQYSNDDIIIIKYTKDKDIITGVSEYDSKYFINKVGKDCYDLIKKMLIFNHEKRINIIDILNHDYFYEYGKINVDNFNIESVKNTCLNHNCIIQMRNILIPINTIIKYKSYTHFEYFSNCCEIKYKDLQFKNYREKNVNLEKKLNIDLIKHINYSKIFNIDSYVNTIIFLRNEKNLNKINTKLLDEYFLMLCIIFNSIFTYENGRINYDKFNEICPINIKIFNFIYLECIKIILEDFNIYFYYSILSYFSDKISYEYGIINSDYLINFKLKCVEIFFDIICKKNIKEIKFITLVKYSINTILAKIMNKDIIEYNINPIIDSMKITMDEISLL